MYGIKKTNRAGKFHFGGRYTLMNVNGTWSVYDRNTDSLVKGSPTEHTFTKAQKMLVKFKAQWGD